MCEFGLWYLNFASRMPARSYCIAYGVSLLKATKLRGLPTRPQKLLPHAHLPKSFSWAQMPISTMRYGRGTAFGIFISSLLSVEISVSRAPLKLFRSWSHITFKMCSLRSFLTSFFVLSVQILRRFQSGWQILFYQLECLKYFVYPYIKLWIQRGCFHQRSIPASCLFLHHLPSINYNLYESPQSDLRYPIKDS